MTRAVARLVGLWLLASAAAWSQVPSSASAIVPDPTTSTPQPAPDEPGALLGGAGAVDVSAPSAAPPAQPVLLSAPPSALDTVEVPALTLTDVPFTVTVRGLDSASVSTTRLRVGDQTYALSAGDDGTFLATDVRMPAGRAMAIEVVQGETVIGAATTRTLPGWTSILPPLLAILVALAFRRVIPALFLGVWVGAVLVAGVTPSGVGRGLLDAVQVYVLDALADPDHAAIILFTFLIGGLVGIIQKNGGTQGIVDHVVTWANTPKRGQLATAFLGLVVFFDDYANSLIIGPTMRPVTDRLRISREKLAYIVDSTSAPVASLALVTTWIGFEVGLINEALAEIPTLNLDGYGVFLESILYRFYPVLALFFVFVIAFTDREFGPMYHAEHRARTTGAVLGDDARVDAAASEGAEFVPPDGAPRRALNAIIPVLVLVVGVIVGLFATGEGTSVREIIGSADSYKSLIWASLAGVLVAGALSIGQRILTLDETLDAWYAGLKGMLFTMIILLLAWALSATTSALGTGAYLGSVLSDTLPPGLVPALIFVLAAVTAFATGTSWGTMGILMPLVVPLTWGVMQANEIADPEHYYLLYSAVSCVLAGAVWGDHCSPISDTTILSSMASGCDHIAHVRTQLPYALLVGVVGILAGTIPTGYGVPWWLSMLVGAGVLLLGLRLLGKPVAGHDEVVVPAEA